MLEIDGHLHHIKVVRLCDEYICNWSRHLSKSKYSAALVLIPPV